MVWNVCILLPLVAMVTVDVEASNCTSTTTAGIHFMIGIPASNNLPDKIVLHITAENSTEVTVRAPNIHFLETYSLKDHVQVNLSTQIIHRSSGSSSTSHKGIEIKSVLPCSVTVLTHDGNDDAEGYLAYPVNALSTNYVISSFDPVNGASSEFLLVGVENQTHAVLNKRYGYYSRTERVTLNEFDTYMFKSTYDVSDSGISSDKPIAVFSASGSSKIPKNRGDYQYLVEQMTPVKFWAKDYIVPALFPREYYLLRIYSSENQTTLRRYYDNTSSNEVVEPPKHKETIVSQPAVVMADKPISVIQYGYDSDGMDGDPFMTTVQAISQFVNSYEFVTDFDYMGSSIWEVTLVLTVLTSEIPNILLDGSNRIIRLYGHVLPVPTPYSNYSVVYLNMTSPTYGSFHTLRHELGKPFGATIYSFPGSAAAYGYPLKFALRDKVCQALTLTTTTTSTTTTSTTTTTTTTTTTAPTTATTTQPPKPTTAMTITTKQTFSGNNTAAIKCFNCRDIPHLRYCDTVTTCTGHEVCYVESYTKPHGTKMYRSGCIEKERCVPLSGQNDCLQCCDSSDYCNVDGCEEEAQGSVDAGTRGPYCYDCSHLGENEHCQSVQICPSDQVCMIEKYVWGDNDFSYVQGCIRPHICEAKKRSVSMDRKLSIRHVPVCTHCCATDFCNRNCTHYTVNTPGIIG